MAMIESCWQEQRRDFLENARQAQDNHELLHQYEKLLEQMKIRAMSSFPYDDVLRQQAALLFAQAAQGAQMLLTRGLPTVVQGEKPLNRQSRWQTFLQNPALLYAVLGAGAVFSLLAGGGSWRCALFFGAAMGVAALKERFKPQEAALPTAVAPLQIETLDAFITRQAQLLDQHIADLQLLMQDAVEPLKDSAADPVTMSLCQYAWAAAKSDYPPESALYAAEKLLRMNDLTYVEYSPEARLCFDVMPTKNASRTVYPALKKISDGTLVSKGQYIEK